MKDAHPKFGNLHVLFSMIEDDLKICCGLVEVLEFDSGDLCHVMNEGFTKMEIQKNGDIIFEYEKGEEMRVANVEYERIIELLRYLKEENDIDRELKKRRN